MIEDRPTREELSAEYAALHFSRIDCGCEVADHAGGLVRAAHCPEGRGLEWRKTTSIRRFFVSGRKRDSLEYEGMMAAIRDYDAHFHLRGPLTGSEVLWMLAIACVGTGVVAAMASIFGWV